MMGSEYDVVVVGARIAGATLAALVAETGYRVLLVDRDTFPSPTLSTHFFRGAQTLAILQRLGVLASVLELGSPLLTRQYSYLGGSDEALVEPPQDPGALGYALSVRRDRLDYVLVRRAADAGADFCERTRVVDLVREGERVTGVRLATPAGAAVVSARLVVGADGRHSTMARLVAAPVEERYPPDRGLYYRYVRGYASPRGGPLDGPEFSLLDDEMAYVIPSDGGLTCIALSVNLADFAWMRVAHEERFVARLSRHRGVGPRVAVATAVGPLLGCGPEPSYVRVPVGPGWALVGDAGLHQDPWSGHGMDAASVHAAYLAEEVIRWFKGEAAEGASLGAYHRRRNAHGLEQFHQTVTLGRDLRQLAAA